MKELTIGFLGVYAVLFVCLSLLGQQGEYSAEKALWKINRTASRLLQDANNIPKKQVDEIISQYAKFNKNFQDTNIGPRGYFQMAQVYWTIKDYQNGRTVIKKMISTYPSRQEIVAEGYTQIGASYVEEGDTPAAIENYKTVLTQYPLTPTGMNVPIFIAQAYMQAKNIPAAQTAYAMAIKHYYALINNNTQNPLIEIESLRKVSAVYIAQGDWQNAAQTLSSLIIKYPRKLSPGMADEIVKLVNTIVLSQTKDYDFAINLYNQFINENPEHPYNQVFKNLIQGYTNLKTNKK